MDEASALAIVFANTRRIKRTEDLVTVAESFDYLVQLYGSRKAVAEKVGLSTEMVREFLTVLELPNEVKKLVSSREIDRLDVAREIYMLKDPVRQIAAAEAIARLPSKDVRDIRRLAQHADLPIEESRRIVLDSKAKGLHIFLIDFDDETYDALVNLARRYDTEPAELVRQVVLDWLGERTKRTQE